MAKFLQSVLTVILAVAIALFIKEFLFEPELIPSGSMIPNLNVGDRIVVNRFVYGIQNPFYNATKKKSIMLLLPNPLYKKQWFLSHNKYFLKFNKPLKRFDIIVFFPPEKPVEGYTYYLDNKENTAPLYFQDPPMIGERYVKRLIGLPGELIEMRNGDIYINDKLLQETHARNKDYTDFGPFRIPSGNYFMMGDNRPRSADSRFWGTVPDEDILGRASLVIWPPSAVRFTK